METAQLLYAYSGEDASGALVQKPADSMVYFVGNPKKTLAQFKDKDAYHFFLESVVAVNIRTINGHKFGFISDSVSTAVYQYKGKSINFLFHLSDTALGWNVEADPIDINNDGFTDIVMRYASGGIYGEDNYCLLFNPREQRLEYSGQKLHDVTLDPAARQIHSNWKFVKETYNIVGTEFSLHQREIEPDNAENADIRRIPAIKILDRCLSKAKMLDADSLLYPINNDSLDNEARRIIVGKFIDGKKLYAIDVDSPDENAVFDLYEYDGQWRKAGGQQTANSVWNIEFTDYDSDGRNEITIIGHPNMNGNSEIGFYYVPQQAPVHYAGGYFGTVNENDIDKQNKTLDATYAGSWYAPEIYTHYIWRNEKLIPVRQLVLSLKKADMRHNAKWFEYYENPTNNKDSLLLKYKKTFRQNKKQQAIMKTFRMYGDSI
ncbi:hypothetical protein [Flavobacterium sp. BFFFF1]|uniref:hypothetical protein n=1 Tax=Flavobacterium sp. BFFFF1 TaxID=2015557 RepID=UPI0025C06271|nr:hypothetical protein [Flavobacterium sp. BFFFF1]